MEITAIRQPDPSLVSYTHIIYALHAASVLIGLTTAAWVLTAFIFGVPSIIAVIMNYMRRSEAKGTFLESHFRWQIQTFWYAALGVAISWLVSLPLMVVLIGFITLGVLLFALSVWVVYRVVRGWLRLKNGQPIEAAF